MLGKPKKEAPPPDELVYRRDTGEPWAYRRDGVLYRISDDEPVQARQGARVPFGLKRRKHDFSAPQPSDPPDAQDEHEGQAARGDPDEGALPREEPVPDPEQE